MNNLTVFNNDIIPVYTTDAGEKVVIGRELHERLKIATDYKDWFPRMCEYGFSEPKDFSSFLSESKGVVLPSITSSPLTWQSISP